MAEPPRYTVKLPLHEVSIAYAIAGQQTARALHWKEHGRNGKPYSGRNSDVFDPAKNVCGVLGEFGAARWFELPRTAPLDKLPGDVGDWIEVRASNKFPTHGLRILPDDRDDLPFVCADASMTPIITLHGWDYAGNCKNPEWWHDNLHGMEGFFKPRGLLRDCMELKQLAHERVLKLKPGKEAA